MQRRRLTEYENSLKRHFFGAEEKGTIYLPRPIFDIPASAGAF